MSAPTISNAEMLEIQLRKWIGKRHVHNVRLSPSYSHPPVPVGERVIAEVIDRSSQGIFFTGNGFMLPGRGFIWYDDVMAAEWISCEPLQRAMRKPEDYDHIELSLRDDSSITLADVEQSVFPLLHFFEWMLGKRQRQQGTTEGVKN